MIALMAAVVAALPLHAQVGQLVSFSYNNETLCARVVAVDEPPGRVPTAWLVETANPGRTHRVPVPSLTAGCEQAPAAKPPRS